MITRIEALHFRSLRHVALDVQPFQVLVGPNGSGKSSFLDVVGFVGDLLRVGPFRAILGDDKAGVPPRASDPSHLCWMRQGDRFEVAVELRLPSERTGAPTNGRFRRARYEVGVGVAAEGGEVSFTAETLWLAPEREAEARPPQRLLFPERRSPPYSILESRHARTPANWKKVVNKIGESGNDYFFAETSGWQNPFRLGPTKSALANLPEDESRFPAATWVKRVLMEGIERVVLNAAAMRSPSPPGTPRRFRPDGSNLPWVVEDLRRSPERFDRWLEHVRTALPDLRTVRTVERPEDRHRYLVVEFENGLEAPSWLVSDGTLRLLALTLLAYVRDAHGIYLVEEPENGIHPRAVETVYQSLSSVYEAQVLCASHSPVVLSLARPADLLCFAKDDTGATDIVRGDQHPRLIEWKGSLDLGTLFAAGVLE